MTADRIVLIGCAALLVVSVFADTRGAGQGGLDQSTDGKEKPLQISVTSNVPVSAPAPDTWSAQEATDALTRCITAALDEQGHDAPAFYYTDPHTERTLAIFCDAVRPVKVVSLERRFVP